ncbi:MAG: hypothetical protein DMG91_06310 [Acidobacteria bacterium]|nr:MAG: hypothetical protein DMG91_06310 [Acidobacteriota bacterium]
MRGLSRDFLSTIILLVCCVVSLCAGQSAPAAQGRKTSPPYTGDLTIFDSPGRDERLQIGRVMDILGIGEGKSVADIGAGSGWFTVRAARRVAQGGTVYAVDINPEAKRYVEQRAAKEHLGNVKNHGVNSEVVVKEAESAGYKVIGKYDFVKDGMDYFLVFQAKD